MKRSWHSGMELPLLSLSTTIFNSEAILAIPARYVRYADICIRNCRLVCVYILCKIDVVWATSHQLYRVDGSSWSTIYIKNASSQLHYHCDHFAHRPHRLTQTCVQQD